MRCRVKHARIQDFLPVGGGGVGGGALEPGQLHVYM